MHSVTGIDKIKIIYFVLKNAVIPHVAGLTFCFIGGLVFVFHGQSILSAVHEKLNFI